MNEGYIGPDVSVPNVISNGNGQAAGLTFAFGQHTTATANDTIVTGLERCIGAMAVLDDPPVAGCQNAQAQITAGSGSIAIKTWKATATADTALIAATTFSRKVNWIAWGYRKS